MKYPKQVKYNNFYSNSTERGISTDIYNKMSDNTAYKKLVLYNDSDNNIEDVVYSLIYALGYSDIQAQQITLLAHSTGKCVIMKDTEKRIKRYYNKLKGYSLDVKIED